MSDLISRKALLDKLQEHHDFFTDAYGGFSNMPLTDKARVDEITNCIAEVVNMPSVSTTDSSTGQWEDIPFSHYYRCSECGRIDFNTTPFCPYCGKPMKVRTSK